MYIIILHIPGRAAVWQQFDYTHIKQTNKQTNYTTFYPALDIHTHTNGLLRFLPPRKQTTSPLHHVDSDSVYLTLTLPPYLDPTYSGYNTHIYRRHRQTIPKILSIILTTIKQAPTHCLQDSRMAATSSSSATPDDMHIYEFRLASFSKIHPRRRNSNAAGKAAQPPFKWPHTSPSVEKVCLCLLMPSLPFHPTIRI